MKKDETRFTVRFNPADPRHRTTMDILGLAGRRKATLIADAVCEYLARHRDVSAPGYLPQNLHIPNAGPKHRKHEEDAAIVAKSTPDVEFIEKAGDDIRNVDSNEESPFDDDISQAILDGLSMFTSSDEP